MLNLLTNQYVLTYRDILDQMVDSQGGAPDALDDRVLRRAMVEAYRQLTSDHDWTYLHREGQIITQEPYSTGTITYTNSTRSLTLASGTWPTWAALGKVRIGNTVSIVDSRTSDSVIVLDPQVNPGEDVAAGTSYTLFKSEYALPVDFVKMTEVLQEASWWGARYISPEQFILLERYGSGVGTPQAWTILGDSNYYGALAVALYPAPDATNTLKFLYYRRPRPLKFDGYSAAAADGTVAVSSTTVTGTGTAFSSDMIGSVIRVSANTTKPTGLDGPDIFTDERIITAVASATSLTINSAGTTATGKAYNISDPVDIDETMIPAFRYLIERWVAFFRRNYDAMGVAEAMYKQELLRAAAADQRNLSRRGVGRNFGTSNRLANWPSDTE